MIDFELDDLKREFLTEADEKVREMQAMADAGDRESLERLAYLAHQLKGSGGSYGFQRISTDAADLERAIERLTENGNGDGANAAIEGEIQQHVVNLRTEIEKRSKELGPSA